MSALSNLTWTEVEEYLRRDNRIILPLGATEEHGPHLGLGTDFIEAEAIAHLTSEASGVIVAPTLNYGMSQAMMGFPGTISFSPKTLMAVIEDILNSLHHHGFQRILIVNGHGGNTAAIENSVQTMSGISVKLFEWWKDVETNHVVVETMGIQAGSHASFAETALMLAIRPSAVKMEYLSGKDAPVRPSRDLLTVQTFRSVYPDGVMGLNPAGATPEAGEAVLNKAVEICVKELNDWSIV
jgi:creatinine amidohydrolase